MLILASASPRRRELLTQAGFVFEVHPAHIPEDPYINEKFSIKHDELGEMYFHHSRFKEALEQYFKALSLSSRKPELSMKIVESFVRLNELDKATKHLQGLIKDYPGFLSARVRLGKMLYDGGDVQGAIEQWEATTHRDPNHGEAQRLLRQAQAITHRTMEY